ncbi:MAG: hypothetical protein ABW167_05280 [Baekduia sp.]
MSADLEVDDTVVLYGRAHKIHAAKLIEEGPARMLLVTPEGADPHPFDWWPESSVLREMTP